MSEIEKKLVTAASLIQAALSESTGLREHEQKLIAYWSLATHALTSLNTFPALVLIGKMGTGKSQALKILADFAFRPSRMSLRGMTGPAIRDKLADCYEGTAIIEEADAAWKDKESSFERLISDRYQRDSAKASLKYRVGDKSWETVTKDYFGATALHRRALFGDSALDGRSVFVRCRPNHIRKYRDYEDQDPRNAKGQELIGEMTFPLPGICQPDGIAARVFNSYRPLLGVSRICGDSDFEENMLARLLEETNELKEAQASEPESLVLGAIIETVYAHGAHVFDNIKFGALGELIWKNHRVSVAPRQIGRMARELGFSTKTSHGLTVLVPTAKTLVKACTESDYSDDCIEELRQELQNPFRTDE